MAIKTPKILVPNEVGSFRTTSKSQIVGGVYASDANAILYRCFLTEESTGATPIFVGDYQSVAVTLALESKVADDESLPWSINTGAMGLSLSSGKILYLEIVAANLSTGEMSPPIYLDVTYTSVATSTITSSSPSGLLIYRSSTALIPAIISVASRANSEELLGYNFYVSTEVGGGTSGYTLINKEYIREPSGIRKYESPLQSQEVSADQIVTKTTTSYVTGYEEFSCRLDGERLSELLAVGMLPSQTYDSTVNFYFVATSVYYDKALEQVVESVMSTEVSARFITFSAVFSEIPVRNRDHISLTLLQRLFGKNKTASALASSVYKDILDPVSEEFEDYYIIQDFLACAMSIKGLVQFDDENGDGESDPVESSLKKAKLKIALKVTSSSAVQNLIDSFFDKRASNACVTRQKAVASQGKALLYADNIPAEGLYINDGAIITTGPGYGENGTSLSFKVKGSRTISYASRSVYFNVTTKRYEIEVPVVAMSAGTASNVPAGALQQVTSGIDPRFKVTNTSPLMGGSSKESNLSLANRTQLAMAGLDSGTRGGYLKAAQEIPGVRSVQVQVAGDTLMLRDTLTDGNGNTVHVGGKIDIYVQSEILGEKQDVIAYSYEAPQGAGNAENFFVEDATNLRIRTTNSAVTVATPIIEVARVTNVTRGSQDYDIGGAQVGIGDGDTLQLSANTQNLKIGMATNDVITVAYRYRGSSTFILENQPVTAITSVYGDIDGGLSTSNYALVKLEDPLLLGNSTKASDGLLIKPSGSIPSARTARAVETHTFMESSPLRLLKKGVLIDTLIVSEDAAGVYTYLKDVDYTIGKGGIAGYTYLYLQPYSKIRKGTPIYITYRHGQNFKVTYLVNESLQMVQQAADKIRHGAADVAVKGSIQNIVDLYIAVVREKGFSQSDIEQKIQTLLGNYISNLRVGESLLMDDVIAMVKSVKGVRRVVLPITRMMKKNGSFIPGDYIGYANFQVYMNNASKGITSYITVSPVLNYGTVSGGGLEERFRAVYEDGKPLVTAESALDVSVAKGRAYILADGRLVLSTRDGAPPQNKEYKAAYYTYVSPGEEFANDITTDTTENLIVDSGSITIDAKAEV